MSEPLTPDQAAKFLKISRRTLLAKANKGLISGNKSLAGKWLFLESDLIADLRKGYNQPRQAGANNGDVLCLSASTQKREPGSTGAKSHLMEKSLLSNRLNERLKPKQSSKQESGKKNSGGFRPWVKSQDIPPSKQ